MSFLFGGKHVDSLETMRTPERLPPTESAAKLHCRRVYYQIMVWMGMEEDMDAMNWGESYWIIGSSH